MYRRQKCGLKNGLVFSAYLEKAYPSGFLRRGSVSLAGPRLSSDTWERPHTHTSKQASRTLFVFALRLSARADLPYRLSTRRSLAFFSISSPALAVAAAVRRLSSGMVRMFEPTQSAKLLLFSAFGFLSPARSRDALFAECPSVVCLSPRPVATVAIPFRPCLFSVVCCFFLASAAARRFLSRAEAYLSDEEAVVLLAEVGASLAAPPFQTLATF